MSHSHRRKKYKLPKNPRVMRVRARDYDHNHLGLMGQWTVTLDDEGWPVPENFYSWTHPSGYWHERYATAMDLAQVRTMIVDHIKSVRRAHEQAQDADQGHAST